MAKYFSSKNLTFILSFFIVFILILGIYWGVKNSFKKEDLSSITAEELKQKIEAGESFVLIDLRSEIEFKQNHLPKAISIPIFDLTEKSKDLSKNSLIIVYCGGNDCEISEQARDKLLSLGFKNIRVYPGGYLEWADKDFPLTKENGSVSYSKSLPFLVVIAGLTDGINPCAIGVLLFLLGYLIIFSEKPEKTKLIGSIYVITTFLTYLLLGLVLYNSLSLLSSSSYRAIGQYIDFLLISILIFAAVINIKDYFFYGRGLVLQIPQRTRGFLNRLVEIGTLPATILLAFFVTFFEAPCSLPLYIGTLRALNGISGSAALILGYMLLYNLMFVLPLIVILVLVVFGEKMVILKEWEHKNKRKMKLGMGLVQLILAIWLLFR